MTREEELHIKGILIAQSYLIEALLLHATAAADDPIEVVQKLTKKLQLQVAHDYAANEPIFQTAERESVMAGVSRYFSEMQKRLIGQFANDPPLSGETH